MTKTSSNLFHSLLSFSTLCHVFCATCLISSSHHLGGLFLFLFLRYHCVTNLLYLCLPLIVCPAHLHLIMFRIMSFTFVLHLMEWLFSLSDFLTPFIPLSIASWQVFSLFLINFVEDHVCHPYVKIGIEQFTFGW